MREQIEVNGGKQSAYIYGEGSPTVVLLSGSGVLIPELEYMSFAKALAERFHVVGIEKMGYGHSDLAGNERTIDRIVEEHRNVLKKIDVKLPVIMAAHSMGFLEALCWGQKYPEEVAGIIGIDPATPEAYGDFNIEAAEEGLKQMAANEGLRNRMIEQQLELLDAEQHFTTDQKSEMENLANTRFANSDWISEAANLRAGIAQIVQNQPYLQVPMLFYLSNGEGTSLEKEIWRNHALHYLNNIKIKQYEFFELPHNLYKVAYREMAETAKQFIAENIN